MSLAGPSVCQLVRTFLSAVLTMLRLGLPPNMGQEPVLALGSLDRASAVPRKVQPSRHKAASNRARGALRTRAANGQQSSIVKAPVGCLGDVSVATQRAAQRTYFLMAYSRGSV